MDHHAVHEPSSICYNFELIANSFFYNFHTSKCLNEFQEEIYLNILVLIIILVEGDTSLLNKSLNFKK